MYFIVGVVEMASSLGCLQATRGGAQLPRLQELISARFPSLHSLEYQSRAVSRTTSDVGVVLSKKSIDTWSNEGRRSLVLGWGWVWNTEMPLISCLLGPMAVEECCTAYPGELVMNLQRQRIPLTLERPELRHQS